MKKIANFIVEKWFIFLALFILFGIYSFIELPHVNINYDMIKYLPENSETSVAINIMNEEFGDRAEAHVMVKNVSIDEANQIKKEIENTKGVYAVTFNGDNLDYKNDSALFTVMLTTGNSDLKTGESIDNLKKTLSKYDTALNGTAVSMLNMKKAIDKQMPLMLGVVCIIILIVLFITSKSYIEPIIFAIVIGESVLLNLGTNVWLDSVSFITNSVCAIMQLAIAMDYAIMLLHRFVEEKQYYKTNEEALVSALSSSISSISASSLTTIAGLFAITQIQFRLGYDLGIVLIKGIVCSMLTVFFFMPGIILLFNKVIEKTAHKSFLPKMDSLSTFVIKTRKILPILIITLIGACFFVQQNLKYDYSLTTIGANCDEESSAQNDLIVNTYGEDATFIILVPKGEYDKESKVTKYLNDLTVDTWKPVDQITAIAATPLGENLTAKEFAAEYKIPTLMTRVLYRYLGKDPNHKVLTMDLIDALYENKDTFIMSFFDDKIMDLKSQSDYAKGLLESSRYDRILFTVNASADSEEAFNLVDVLRNDLKEIYKNENFYLFGDTVNMYDIKSTFGNDINKANAVTLISIAVILLFTFGSIFLSVALVGAVQGAVWINLALIVATGVPAFFANPVIVSCIQMGACIDYAILITTRYKEGRKNELSKEDACRHAISSSMPTILTSGTILVVAGYVIGNISSISVISSIGSLLGRGALLSILLVVILVPQLLMLGDNIFMNRHFTMSDLLEKAIKLENERKQKEEAKENERCNNSCVNNDTSITAVSDQSNTNQDLNNSEASIN